MADRAATLFGIPIRVSPHLAPPGAERGYDDWRERLRRNLARPSTGRWEPLTYPLPSVLMIGGTMVMHPAALAALHNVALGNDLIPPARHHGKEKR